MPASRKPLFQYDWLGPIQTSDIEDPKFHAPPPREDGRRRSPFSPRGGPSPLAWRLGKDGALHADLSMITRDIGFDFEYVCAKVRLFPNSQFHVALHGYVFGLHVGVFASMAEADSAVVEYLKETIRSHRAKEEERKAEFARLMEF